MWITAKLKILLTSIEGNWWKRLTLLMNRQRRRETHSVVDCLPDRSRDIVIVSVTARLYESQIIQLTDCNDLELQTFIFVVIVQSFWVMWPQISMWWCGVRCQVKWNCNDDIKNSYSIFVLSFINNFPHFKISIDILMTRTIINFKSKLKFRRYTNSLLLSMEFKLLDHQIVLILFIYLFKFIRGALQKY